MHDICKILKYMDTLKYQKLSPLQKKERKREGGRGKRKGERGKGKYLEHTD